MKSGGYRIWCLESSNPWDGACFSDGPWGPKQSAFLTASQVESGLPVHMSHFEWGGSWPLGRVRLLLASHPGPAGMQPLLVGCLGVPHCGLHVLALLQGRLLCPASGRAVSRWPRGISLQRAPQVEVMPSPGQPTPGD